MGGIRAPDCGGRHGADTRAGVLPPGAMVVIATLAFGRR